MKFIIFLITILFSTIAMSQTSVKTHVENNQINKKFLFSWRASFSGLNSGSNQGVDIWGIEGYSRFALNNNHGFNFSMTKFITSDKGYIVENGAVGTRLSLGYSFALTGSLIDQTNITKINRFYFKKNKFKVKEKIITESVPFNGWRVDLNVGHMNFNSYNRNLYSFSGSTYYEHKLNSAKMQYGIKYDKASSTNGIDINFIQFFIGIGFTP
jgi:hypothetical protein